MGVGRYIGEEIKVEELVPLSPTWLIEYNSSRKRRYLLMRLRIVWSEGLNSWRKECIFLQSQSCISKQIFNYSCKNNQNFQMSAGTKI